MKKILKTNHHSYKTGNLCEGCKQCVQGKKLVLFITGICPNKCFYCPISQDKYGFDDVYANEWKLKNPEEFSSVLEEIKATSAIGAGITGGDPLSRVDRTCTYIKLLKKHDKNFHVHLYTTFKLVNLETLKKLYEAGLDEIRFHPDIEDETLWTKISLAKQFPWKVGIEIPVIPDKYLKTKKLLKFMIGKVDFVNLNELEISDTDLKHYTLDERGYKKAEPISQAVKKSKDVGLKLLKFLGENNLSGHLCTAKLKDSIQVGKRLKLRAKNVKEKFDLVTTEGLLIRGAIYPEKYIPPSKEKISGNELKKILIKIKKETKLTEKELKLDVERNRLLLSKKNIKKYAETIKKLNLVPCIVEEYPTQDAFCVDLQFL